MEARVGIESAIESLLLRSSGSLDWKVVRRQTNGTGVAFI